MKGIIFGIMFILLLASVNALTVEIVNTDPAPAEAGEYVDLTVRINLESDTIIYDDVQFVFDDTRYINFVNKEKTYGRVLPNEELTSTFQVYIDEDAPQGEINLEGSVIRSGFVQRFILPLYVEENDAKPDIRIGNLKTTPSRVLPDSDDNELVMTLNNLGDREAELIVAEIEPRDEAIRESFTYGFRDSLASIEGGESGDLTFYFDVEEIQPKVIEADLILSYRIPQDGSSESETVERRVPFNIPITNTPYLEIKEVRQLSDFKVGTAENIIELVIVNNGNKDAEDVRIRFYPDVSFPFSFDRTTRYVLADMEPGEETAVRFEIEVFNSASALDYPLAVELESLVGSARYSRDETISLKVSAGRDQSIPTHFIVIGVILIVAIGVGIYQFRRNRKKK